MAQLFPYTYISCPCSDEPRQIALPNRASRDIQLEEDNQDEEQTFDPRSPRSNFSLFPPEHLLYCEDCHAIKCSRCITEEIICWYCPGCLFEVPSSSVKQDDNRCARNCFQCPICMSQLITAAVGEKRAAPYVLSCNYCMWSSLDVGLQFDEKATRLRQTMDIRGIQGIKKKAGQMAAENERVRRAPGGSSVGSRLQLSRELSAEDIHSEEKSKKEADSRSKMEPNAQFLALKAFYKEQIALTSGGVSGSSLDNFASPSSLTRIMNLYNNPGSRSVRTTKPQTTPMREALSLNEGLVLQSEIDEVPQPIPDFIDATTPEQQRFQYPIIAGTPIAKHVSQLWPMSTKLRTKRSKRCAECKHILVKPEFKVTSTRYRIKLVALNYIPLISLKPLPVPGGLKPPGPDGADVVLEPGKVSQWIMKFTNPLFENVNVTLGSPSVTPGKHGHKVTFLCPQFSIGKNGDVWDDALNPGMSKTVTNTESGGEQVAGKVYESGRNWASIVVEIVPVAITKEKDEDNGARELDEDEDVIEIPIKVRLDWTVSEDDTERVKKKSEKALDDEAEVDDGKRELAYWMVVGVGRVAT